MTRHRRIEPPIAMQYTVVALLALSLAVLSPARAQTNNPCDQPGEYPDLLAAEIATSARWGTDEGITAFSLGFTACNLGSCWANWFAGTSDHPAMGQNMFRLDNGRFEQIGQSWVFHEFFALSSGYCSSSCIGSDGSHLGVNCSSIGSPNYSGTQSRLGPKSEVNPSSGTFPFPASGMSSTGGAIYKRLQVHNDDLDPQHHPGALYWVEVQFVARDDIEAGNKDNSVSYRPIAVFGSGSFNIAMTGSTVTAQPAIAAWKGIDSNVTIGDATVPNDGRYIIGSRVTATASGYHYEYAVQNLSSHRAAATFTVPIPAGAEVTGIGFHDVDYHSGELISGTDWTATVTDGAVVWTTEPYAVNPDANALRWGTLYNFRFDSPVPPTAGQAELGLFRPGLPTQVAASAAVPCHGADLDADSHWSSCDCDDGNGQAWGIPGEVDTLSMTHDASVGTVLSFSPAADSGAATVIYEALRSSDPSDFVSAATCLPASDSSSLTRSDVEDPPPGGLFGYLVRARNACPDGEGSLGMGSAGALRQGVSCP